MSQNKTSYDFFYLFRDVMRSGSYQKAARDSGCTVSAISQKISQMEKELGIDLFEEGSDGMAPTAAGLFLYDKLDTVLWNLDSIVQQARSIPSENSMTLNLGISEMLPGSVYRPLLQHFIRNYPHVKLTLSSPPWRELTRRLIDGRMDAALSFSIALANEPRLTKKPLTRSKPCIYYNEQLPVENPENISINSFRNCDFVCLNTDVAAMDMLRDLPFEPDRVIFTDSLKDLYLFVNAGLACTVLGPDQQLAETAGISFFSLSDMPYSMGIDLFLEKSNDNPAVSLLTDCADKVYEPVRRGDLNGPF